jgi:hypothetical protein
MMIKNKQGIMGLAYLKTAGFLFGILSAFQAL